MLSKIKLYLKKNYLLCITVLLFFVALVYCSINTYVMNDDLGYSFFYRTSTRVTNILQIIKNQVSDYFIVNSRVFIHAIVQFLLIFGKNV